MSEIRLSQYSHGAGCGCKLAPDVLENILGQNKDKQLFKSLLVGNDSKDDAAVFDLGDGSAMVSTTDFFTPIVDDPFDFGYIAAVNAISDIYAMGGTPLMAIAILGWPIDKLPAEVAAEVVNGGRHACKSAGIPLAGGHSIDIPEPIFGLAVSGRVSVEQIKRNNQAKEGDVLFLTKPLGIGLVTTAEKRGLASEADKLMAKQSMMKLNDIALRLAPLNEVHAITDVTGFGLAGHLIELCEGSDLKAELEWDQIPRFPFTNNYIEQKCIPGGTNRNWRSYRMKVSEVSENEKALLADPQTSGGLLISVDPKNAQALAGILNDAELPNQIIGRLKKASKAEKVLSVNRAQ
jgi:selenide,water dikinase